jgi:hypothetical protein
MTAVRVRITELDRARARRAIDQRIAVFRQIGTVDIEDAAFGLIARIHFTPRATGDFDDDDWSAVREPCSIVLDPLGLVDRARAQVSV